VVYYLALSISPHDTKNSRTVSVDGAKHVVDRVVSGHFPDIGDDSFDFAGVCRRCLGPDHLWIYEEY
jgi:hypothetical protein